MIPGPRRPWNLPHRNAERCAASVWRKPSRRTTFRAGRRLLVFAHSDRGAVEPRYERSVPMHGVKLGETASGIRVSSYPAAAATFATRRGLTAEPAPPVSRDRRPRHTPRWARFAKPAEQHTSSTDDVAVLEVGPSQSLDSDEHVMPGPA